MSASSAWWRRSKLDLPYLSFTAASLRRRIRARKFPLPHAGSRKRESMRSVSSFTRSSIASTIHAGVNTSPWSATGCLDFTRLMRNCGGSILNDLLRDLLETISDFPAIEKLIRWTQCPCSRVPVRLARQRPSARSALGTGSTYPARSQSCKWSIWRERYHIRW